MAVAVTVVPSSESEEMVDLLHVPAGAFAGRCGLAIRRQCGW